MEHWMRVTQKIKQNYHMIQQHISGYIPKRTENKYGTDTCASMFIAALFRIADDGGNPSVWIGKQNVVCTYMQWNWGRREMSSMLSSPSLFPVDRYSKIKTMAGTERSWVLSKEKTKTPHSSHSWGWGELSNYTRTERLPGGQKEGHASSPWVVSTFP